MDKTPASRESSEFEFVGNNNGGGSGASNVPPQQQQVTAAAAAAILPAVAEASTASGAGDHPPPSLFGWVKGSSILSRVAEKTKSSMETVITTLDPQMKDYIRSGGGGDVVVVVASDKDVKVRAVKSAFQQVMGRGGVATVFGVAAARGSTIAEQPVGFAAGKQAAQERVQFVKSQHQGEAVVVVGVENFLLEVGNDDWVDVGCIMLHDEARNIRLKGYTQPTPVDAKLVAILKDATPDSYPKKWSGFARSIGEVMEECDLASHKDWHAVLGGVPRSELIRLATISLAHVYQKTLMGAKVDSI